MPRATATTSDVLGDRASHRRDDRVGVASAIVYPVFVYFAGPAVATARATGSSWATGIAVIVIVSMFLPSTVGAWALIRGGRKPGRPASNALAALVFAVPSLFTIVVTLSSATGSRVAIAPAWIAVWLVLAVLLLGRRASFAHTTPRGVPGWLRHAHGWMAAALLVVFIGIHVLSHLTALWSVRLNHTTLSVLRTWYRHDVVESALLALVAGMLVTGGRMAWTHFAGAMDRFRAVQLLAGTYLAVFLCSHVMATLRARAGGTDTDWSFAAGPSYTLLDGSFLRARLIPHYAMAVIVVGVHLATGLRSVMLAHDVSETTASRVCLVLGAITVALSLLVLAALLGVHVGGN